MKFNFSPYIAIQVKDYEKAIDFYQRVLGMELTEIRGKDTYLKSYPCSDNIGAINFCFENEGIPGQVFFEFQVDSVKEAKALLENEGCKMVKIYNEKSFMMATHSV
jgi:catechol 2,3-dioxygenase-like lactoylglutathione lyase family enzyme